LPPCNEVWIRRAKGRVSSKTKKFVYSCILRGSTASSRSTVSYLPKKSITPRKLDYMKVPDLMQFSKKDQNIQKDLNRFDFTAVEPKNEGEKDELPTDANESSTPSQKNKVEFPRSNSAEEILWIGMDQSASRISSRAAMPPIDQSEPSACATPDQSEAIRILPDCNKSSDCSQFVSCVLPSTESTVVISDATNFGSNSINSLENGTRPYSSTFLRPILTNLVCLIWSSRRILRRTKPRKRRRYRLISAICAVIGLCNVRTIASICYGITESLGMAFLRFIQTLMLGTANTSEDRAIEPDSDD